MSARFSVRALARFMVRQGGTTTSASTHFSKSVSFIEAQQKTESYRREVSRERNKLSSEQQSSATRIAEIEVKRNPIQPVLNFIETESGSVDEKREILFGYQVENVAPVAFHYDVYLSESDLISKKAVKKSDLDRYIYDTSFTPETPIQTQGIHYARFECKLRLSGELIVIITPVTTTT